MSGKLWVIPYAAGAGATAIAGATIPFTTNSALPLIIGFTILCAMLTLAIPEVAEL